MTMDNQRIGRRGEKRFELLCTDGGITCNRSVEDDFGWDKLIEFPAQTLPFAAIDMQPEHVVAAVQVKTTVTASRSVSISLSNALRYAKASIPQFIVLVALDGSEPRYFVRHVWGSLIADWLKAGRQADADGITATHLKTVTLNFTPEDERTAVDLLPWIRAEIDGVPPVYAATKKLFVDTVGFENGYGLAQMTFSLESADDILDIELGLKQHLDLKRFVHTSERFGIRAGKPEIDEENVQIHLTPEGRRCTLRLEFPRVGNITIPATLYSANANGKSAIRVASRVIDVTYGPHKRMRAHAQLARDERATLDELCAYTHLLATKAGEGVSLYVEVDGEVHDFGAISMKGPTTGHEWTWMAFGMDVMRAIARDSGHAVADVSMTQLDEVAGDLEILSALATDRIIRVDFTPEPQAPAKFAGFLAYTQAVIGDQVFSAVAYRPIGKDTKRGARRRVFFGAGKLLWGRIAPREGATDDAVRAAYQRQLDHYSVAGDILAVGDLKRMVREGSGDQVLKCDLPTGRARPTQLGPRKLARRPRN